MRYHDMNGGDWFWMGGVMLVLVAAVVALIIFGFGRNGRGNSPRHTPDEVLHHRLASGEIDTDEFQRRLDAIHSSRVR